MWTYHLYFQWFFKFQFPNLRSLVVQADRQHLSHFHFQTFRLSLSHFHTFKISRVWMFKRTVSAFCFRPGVRLLRPRPPRFRLRGRDHWEPLSQVSNWYCWKSEVFLWFTILYFLIFKPLCDRFKRDQIYTWVSSVLVSINSYKKLSLYTPEVVIHFIHIKICINSYLSKMGNAHWACDTPRGGSQKYFHTRTQSLYFSKTQMFPWKVTWMDNTYMFYWIVINGQCNIFL